MKTILFALSVIAMLLAGCVAGASPSESGAASATIAPALATLPPDLVDTQAVSPASPSDLALAKITPDQALALAKEQGALWDGGTVFLGRLNRFGETNRLSWVVRFVGVSIAAPGAGKASVAPFTKSYCYFDAQTGEFVGGLYRD